MKANYTHIVLVLDKSGSMQHIQSDTVGSVSKFIKDQKSTPGEATFQLIQFDTNHHAGPIRNLADQPDFGPSDYKPDGYTALLDAVGKAIEYTGSFLSVKPEHERPSRVIVVIVTDGEENSSRRFSRGEIFEKVTLQKDVYKWDFVFLGANIDSFAAAGAIGISASATSNYAHNSAGTAKAFDYTSKKISMLRCCADTGEKYSFSKEEQDDMQNS